MAAQLSWSQFINPQYSTPCQTGPQLGLNTVTGSLMYSPLAVVSPPGYVFQRYEKSFLRLDPGDVAGATSSADMQLRKLSVQCCTGYDSADDIQAIVRER